MLKRMNRHYDTARYLETVRALRKVRPEASITSDMIVGFPGETDDDFEATLSIVREVGFDMVYSFIYSPRKGTPAASYTDAIASDIAHERMNRLLSAADAAARHRALPYAGRICRVLVDSPSKDGRPGIMSGRTDTGKLVHFASDCLEIGRFANVKIERAEAFALYGTEIK